MISTPLLYLLHNRTFILMLYIPIPPVMWQRWQLFWQYLSAYASHWLRDRSFSQARKLLKYRLVPCHARIIFHAIVWSKYSSFDITCWHCCFTGWDCTGLITMSSFTCTIAYCFQLTAPTRGLNIAAPTFVTIHAMNNALEKEWMFCYFFWYREISNTSQKK